MRRQLIINADDFGMTRGINLAVSECADSGALRSATLIPNGDAFDHAVKVVKERKNFGVGIHFVLTGFKPLLPVEKLSGLVGPDGFMPSVPGELLEKLGAHKGFADAIKRELFAQAERVFDAGITPTHFDSHKHVHIIPSVLDVLIEIAQRFSVKWMREPFEAGGAWRFVYDIERDQRAGFLKQFAKARTSLVARPIFRSRVRNAGIQTPAGLYGISTTGFMNEKVIRRICGMLKPGLSELMTHPGIVDADLIDRKSRLLYSRAGERSLLLSAKVRELFEQQDIMLSHFGEVNQ
jgi:chitin disaccharide deacetylase